MPAGRFAQFSSEEVAIIYSGILEAPSVTPSWQGTSVYERLKREASEELKTRVDEQQAEATVATPE